MFADLFRGFTATHKTIVIVAALISPGALYGAVAFQAVSIVDSTTGVNALIDNGRRLAVYDPIAGYANNPYYSVRISGSAIGDNTIHPIYTVPTGKALILKSVNFSHYNGAAGKDNFVYFFDVAGASTFIAGFDDAAPIGSHNTNLGNGFYIHSGDTIQYTSYDYQDTALTTFFSIEGYLVPASAVPVAAPTAGVSEIGPQTIRIGNATKS